MPGSNDKRLNYRDRERIRKRLKAMREPCAICGEEIDYDMPQWWIDPKDGKKKKHPLSFEYDHIEPLSVSGDNSWSNAQVAHRICNQKKGDGRRTRRAVIQSKAQKLPDVVTSRDW